MSDMENTEQHISCSLPDMTAYLYSELPDKDAEAFESHLTGCAECIAEFAAISEARLGMYEWKRDEFAHLNTPVFVIPREGTDGFIERFRRSLAGIGTWANAAAAMGAVAIVGAAVYFGIDHSDKPQANFSALNVATVSAPVSIEPDMVKPSGPAPAPKKETAVSDGVRPKPSKVSIRVKTRSNGPVPSAAVASNTRKLSDPRSKNPVPRLSDFEETQDTSLRLADLLADLEERK
jgi:anti-sigma factor RsiW